MPLLRPVNWLGRYLPGEANAVSVVRVAEILNSPRAKVEGWAETANDRFLTGVSRIPPWVDTLVIGSLVRPELHQQVWSTGALELPKNTTIESIARTEASRVDRLGELRSVRSRRNFIMIELRPRMLEVRSPGVQLEQISLAAIIIALGLLVDNAVQVCDQSSTNQMEGMSPVEASITGTTQLSTAMLMGTATTVAAFAPMLIGSTREYVYSLPVTLSITLGISWVLAMTFCTILAAAFIRAPADPTRPSVPLPWLFAKLTALVTKKKNADSSTEQKSDPLDRIFGAAVRACIDFKFVTIGIAAALLVVTLKLPVASEFFPKDMRDQFPIEIFLPENSTIEQTDAVARQVETIIQKLSPLTDAVGQPVADESGESVQQIRAFRTMVGRGGCLWP